LVQKPEGKWPLGRPRSRWEGNTTMDLWEIDWKCLDWIHLTQDRDQWRDDAGAIMNFRFSYLLSASSFEIFNFIVPLFHSYH
jgi:hypothetical protein